MTNVTSAIDKSIDRPNNENDKKQREIIFCESTLEITM